MDMNTRRARIIVSILGFIWFLVYVGVATTLTVFFPQITFGVWFGGFFLFAFAALGIACLIAWIVDAES